MKYRDLYEYCQEQPLYIGRNVIRDKALELTGVPKIPITIVDMDPQHCRGFYLSAKNQDHVMVRQFGGHIVAIARGLNKCWTRFVVVKEFMHLFGDELSAADTGAEFEALLQGINGPDELTPQIQSEFDCFWMALGALCPEAKRLEYAAKRALNEIDDYTIALELKIPQLYVPRLFESRYRKILDRILAS
ncbi:MAG TPA: hypothetical protein VIL88_14800 [Devosia sp.]|jgi:hypothetical protein|uniref:hypothetical protein n=1 Tax=Devosia sp. TaxID=1871048 RepID=UPI002F92637B